MKIAMGAWTVCPLHGAPLGVSEVEKGRTNDIWRIEDEEAIGFVEMDAKLKKAMRVIKLIKQCKGLASTTQDASKFLGKRPVTTWEHGKEDVSKWSERKGDDLY